MPINQGFLRESTIFEFKNYNHSIAQKEIYTTGKDLYSKAKSIMKRWNRDIGTGI